MKPTKPTFKKQPKETGLRSIASPDPVVDIKLNKKVIGFISPPYWSSERHKWSIYFRIKKEVTNESRCPWRNAKLKVEFDTEDEARTYITTNWESLSSKLELVPEED